MTDPTLFPLAPLHAYVSAHWEDGRWHVQVRRYASAPDAGTPALVDRYADLSTAEATDVLLAVASDLLQPTRGWGAL